MFGRFLAYSRGVFARTVGSACLPRDGLCPFKLPKGRTGDCCPHVAQTETD